MSYSTAIDRTQPILKRPPLLKERKKTYKCVVCGALAVDKCEYCYVPLCGYYSCMVSHNEFMKHLKRFIF